MLTKYEKNIFKHKKIIFFVLFVSITLYFWPAALYGDSDYILLLGNSMLPTIDPGSLVITKSQPIYYNGDIVAFQNSAGTNIVHRIIEVNNGVYVTQGDNNPQKDAPIAQEDIIGKAELVIPYMGYMGLFLQTPLGLAMMGVMVIVMLLPKSKSKSNSKLGTKESGSINSVKLVQVGLIANAAHYVIEQIAITMDLGITIPILSNFEPSFASTVFFAIWTFMLIVFFLIAKKSEMMSPNKMNPLKLIIIASSVMVVILKLILMIPLVVAFLS